MTEIRRRTFLGTSAGAVATGSLGLAAGQTASAATPDNAIRPFKVAIPHRDLADLRRRLDDTRWPAMETVADQSQGVRLAKLQALTGYWRKNYNWRKVEAKLNALPQFKTRIDGLDIHFLHIKSRHPNALPLLMTHGWALCWNCSRSSGRSPTRPRSAAVPRTRST